MEAGNTGLRLPEVVVIGAMKCGTSAVHEYLDAHPEVCMSRLKELNFFNGPEEAPETDDAFRAWRSGRWHRGLGWYAAQFDPSAPVRGESSPAYTSPSCPEVPQRMARVLPAARLVYLVRDPLERAMSQYLHHRRDGTEPRPPEEALVDPCSHYVRRSLYHRRLAPFLERFPRGQIHVVVQERLLAHRRREIAALHAHLGLSPHWDDERYGARHHVTGRRLDVPAALRARFMAMVAEDLDRLRETLGDDLAEWS